MSDGTPLAPKATASGRSSSQRRLVFDAVSLTTLASSSSASSAFGEQVELAMLRRENARLRAQLKRQTQTIEDLCRIIKQQTVVAGNGNTTTQVDDETTVAATTAANEDESSADLVPLESTLLAGPSKSLENFIATANVPDFLKQTPSVNSTAEKAHGRSTQQRSATKSDERTKEGDFTTPTKALSSGGGLPLSTGCLRRSRRSATKITVNTPAYYLRENRPDFIERLEKRQDQVRMAALRRAELSRERRAAAAAIIENEHDSRALNVLKSSPRIHAFDPQTMRRETRLRYEQSSLYRDQVQAARRRSEIAASQLLAHLYKLKQREQARTSLKCKKSQN